MRRQSDHLRALENGDIPFSALANWQEILAAMVVRLLWAEEEARRINEPAPPPVPVIEVLLVEVPVVAPLVREVNRVPLYEHFRMHYPPTFEGSTDPINVEQWLDLLTSIIYFMGPKENDGVAYASHIFRDDALIWWGIISQMRDV